MNPHAPSKDPKPVLPYSEEPDAHQRYRAARAVASASADAEECAELLEALGLTPQDGKLVPAQRGQ
ncbi:hypothetical protein B0I33_109133 [Prauserella shujinwangii]|uniref:Uncharacterized protein n=1 Tax=Prauserella shujinwangii TaxID=1453103 RepID=A0A2T0LQ91_9PSEU|nr:hypothetical protein [Prauserella shujinwangii]PRX45470.1 hypothetical protein B0I33_109133 [Prauserella shujinwangii]